MNGDMVYGHEPAVGCMNEQKTDGSGQNENNPIS